MRIRYRVTLQSATLALLLLLGSTIAGPVQAAPGDLVASIPLSAAGYGVSVAVGCDPTVIYYTILFTDFTGDGLLHSMDKLGNDLGSVPIVDPSGAPLLIDEIAYDLPNNVLWGCEHNTNPIRVWMINQGTGAAAPGFVSATGSIGTFRDGIAVDATDGTLWLSGDVSTTVDHYTLLGAPLGVITPADAAGNPLGLISGVQVGIGDLLYIGRDGAGQIVRVKKSDGSFIGSFSSPGGRDEGLECDPISFAPKTVIWSRDFFSPGRLDAIEVESGTCRCGGVTPTARPTWGHIKASYR